MPQYKKTHHKHKHDTHPHTPHTHMTQDKKPDDHRLGATQPHHIYPTTMLNKHPRHITTTPSTRNHHPKGVNVVGPAQIARLDFHPMDPDTREGGRDSRDLQACQPIPSPSWRRWPLVFSVDVAWDLEPKGLARHDHEQVEPDIARSC
jgi:hypothetical protein